MHVYSTAANSPTKLVDIIDVVTFWTKEEDTNFKVAYSSTTLEVGRFFCKWTTTTEYLTKVEELR